MCDGKPEDGWQSLSAAELWQGQQGSPFPSAHWRVDGGCLILHRPLFAPSLHTKAEYGSFELRWEWRMDLRGGNSGVKYLAEYGAPPPYVRQIMGGITAGGLLAAVLGVILLHRARRTGVVLLLLAATVFWFRENGVNMYRHDAFGLEYQMLDDANASEAADPLRRTAALYGIFPSRTAAKPAAIHSSRLIVDHGRVQHWLDGDLVLEYHLDSPSFAQSLANSKFGGDPRFQTRRSGLIQLQAHGAPVTFANLRIRQLP